MSKGRPTRARAARRIAVAMAAAAIGAGAGTGTGAPAPGARDGHSRPRALAVDARGDLVYAALSTADRVAVVDVTSGRPPRLVAKVPVCAFPDALAPLPDGGAVVACRFDPGLRVISRDAGRFGVRVIDAGPEHGHRGIAVDAASRTVYVASPARGGVKIVALAPAPGPAPRRFLATGVFPEALRVVPADAAAGRPRPLLLVANFIGHTVTVHEIADDGALSPPRQTIATAAPVLDLGVAPGGAEAGDLAGALLLLTHEDRQLSRERLSVEGLDSVVLALPAAPPGAATPFVDPGPGRRTALNLGERPRAPLAELQALATITRADGAGTVGGAVAIVGAGTDNLLVAAPAADRLRETAATTVGANPTAVAFLPDGRVVTADRLSDTLTFVGPAAAAVTATVDVGTPERRTRAERGELLFYSRALVPNNVSDGPLSLYTCAACHADGHIDGRRHPSKRNRFMSMTKTCRGLDGTEPFLSIGYPETMAAFADNIVGTHAQGALTAPDTYDRYSVTLRLLSRRGWTQAVLPPDEIRAALAAYMTGIPVEPSPFAPPGRTALDVGERRGLALFRRDCTGCHQLIPATNGDRHVRESAIERALLDARLALTSPRLYDVGPPVLGEGGNNPPSLRGTWAAAPYLSDGSAATLEALLRRTNPDAPKVHAAENASSPPAFSATETADLLAFLRAL